MRRSRGLRTTAAVEHTLQEMVYAHLHVGVTRIDSAAVAYSWLSSPRPGDTLPYTHLRLYLSFHAVAFPRGSWCRLGGSVTSTSTMDDSHHLLQQTSKTSAAIKVTPSSGKFSKQQQLLYRTVDCDHQIPYIFSSHRARGCRIAAAAKMPLLRAGDTVFTSRNSVLACTDFKWFC